MSVEKRLYEALVAYMKDKGLILAEGPMDTLIVPFGTEQRDFYNVPIMLLANKD